MIQVAYHGAASWNAHVISSLVISSFSKLISLSYNRLLLDGSLMLMRLAYFSLTDNKETNLD